MRTADQRVMKTVEIGGFRLGVVAAYHAARVPAAGVYVLLDGKGSPLFCGEGERIGYAAWTDRWDDALREGMTEVAFKIAFERIDRLIIRKHIIERAKPRLNSLAEPAEFRWLALHGT